MNLKRILFILLFLTIALLPSFASAMSATIGIPARYSTVQAGEAVYFETEVKWPENDSRKDLRIEYSVKDSRGVEIAYSKVLKAIETQASFMDSISIPEVTKPGLYKIHVIISDYENLNQDIAASFHVTGTTTTTYILIAVGILGVIMIVLIIEMFVFMRRRGM